ncbi:hypothetical protein [Microbacterium lacus]|uniref:DUF5134 domain-containing protein n=1 Tax=Microbacterium lacus TaxID=415217 RepID=A0ABN2H5I5_9MICO
MAEVLHAGAWIATAVSTCCVAGSGRRLRVRESVLALGMLLAMSDVVLGWGLLPTVGWAGVLLVAALACATAVPGTRSGCPEDRSGPAMDAMGAVLMAGLLLLMSGDVHASGGGHGSHAASGEAMAWLAFAAGVAFASASAHMSLTMRVPTGIPARACALRRTAPLAMGASVVLMAAVALA